MAGKKLIINIKTGKKQLVDDDSNIKIEDVEVIQKTNLTDVAKVIERAKLEGWL